MPQAKGRWTVAGRPTRWLAALLTSMAWMVVIAWAVPKLKRADAVVVALGGSGAALATFGIALWHEQARCARR